MRLKKNLFFVTFILSFICLAFEIVAVICCFCLGDYRLGIQIAILVFFPVIGGMITTIFTKIKIANKFYQKYVCVKLIDQRPPFHEMVQLNNPEILPADNNSVDCESVPNSDPVNENQESANDFGLVR